MSVSFWSVRPEPASAHLDPGRTLINDQVQLSDLRLLKPVGEGDPSGTDDGVNGNTELCIRMSVEHPGHLELHEYLQCDISVDWDAAKPGDPSGRQYEDVPGPNPLGYAEIPLIGLGGKAGGSWSGPEHLGECTPAAPWIVSVQLLEVSSQGIGDILKKVGEALAKPGGATTGSIVGGATSDPRVVLIGVAAAVLGQVLDELFPPSEKANLGNTDLTIAEGDGEDDPEPDPTTSVASANFVYTIEKVVTPLGPCQPPTTITTPSSGSGDHTNRGSTTSGPPSAVRVDRAANRAACSPPPKHVFCVDVAGARASWEQLRAAIRATPLLKAEDGVDDTRAKLDRRFLLGLAGTLGRTAAETELDEAASRRQTPRIAGASTEARRRMYAGERRLRAATSATSAGAATAADALDALDEFERAFNRLAPLVHPNLNAAGDGTSGSNPAPLLAGVGAAAAAVLAVVGFGLRARRRHGRV